MTKIMIRLLLSDRVGLALFTFRINPVMEKFESYKDGTSFPRLDAADQEYVRALAARHRFTFQELRQVSEAAFDLEMWQETPLRQWWEREEAERSTAFHCTLGLTGIRFV